MPFISIRMVKRKKTMPHVGKNVETLIDFWQECKMAQSLWKPD